MTTLAYSDKNFTKKDLPGVVDDLLASEVSNWPLALILNNMVEYEYIVFAVD